MQWHHIVASLSETSRHGALRRRQEGWRPTGHDQSAQDYSGYWRIGGDNLNGWPNQPESDYFAGAIDDVAIYPNCPVPGQGAAHYIDSGRTLGGAPSADRRLRQGRLQLQPGPVLAALREASGTTAKDASPNGADGIYLGGTTQGQPGLVTGGGTATGFDGSSGTVASAGRFSNPTSYSEELWFKTRRPQHGGKLIGFGNQRTALSTTTTGTSTWRGPVS